MVHDFINEDECKELADIRETLGEVKVSLALILELLEPKASAWSMKQIAQCLGCSERTVRRRIHNDHRFPSELAATNYTDVSRIRRTHPRWDPRDILRYRDLKEYESVE